ncbi:MAG: HD domain-containing protein [Anaerotignaceae bacterium]
MNKAIGSKVNFRNDSNTIGVEFFECVKDIIDLDRVKQLDQWEQHNHTSRLQHSINVSYYSFLICKKMGWDYRSAARAGLLHDLYFYDWRVKKSLRSGHASWHPRVAVDNARKLASLNKIEEDAIRKHMWPCTLVPPKYKESYAVTLADKICAIFEFCTSSKKEVVPAHYSSELVKLQEQI